MEHIESEHWPDRGAWSLILVPMCLVVFWKKQHVNILKYGKWPVFGAFLTGREAAKRMVSA